MSVNRPVRSRPLTLGELVVLILVAWALWAMSAHAQVGPVEISPVATGSTVHLCPPHAHSTGDVPRAIDGTLGDPVVAPRDPLGLRKRQGGLR